MKRKAIIAAIISTMLLGSCPAVFASETDKALVSASTDTSDTSTAADAADSAVAAVPVVTSLSLSEAIKIMQTTGTSAETAKLNKQSDEAVARGYKETVQSIKKAFDSLDEMQALINRYGSSFVESQLQAQGTSVMGTYSSVEAAGATVTNEKIMKLRRDFANAHIDSNYQAELNGIEYTTVQLYYGVLLASENLKITQDNLSTQQEILKNTEAQYNVGMVAKKDVLAAQSAVESAKSDVKAADTKLSNARMSFNFLLGYPVMQKVNFTDTLSPIDAPAEKSDVYVEQALKNRMELDGAEYARKVHSMLLESMKYRYPSTSSTYLTEQAAYLNAAKTAKDAPNKIEIDIRTQYAAIQDAKAAMESARSTQTYAQEGYRLVNLSYQAGMCTLAEVQSAQVLSYKASLGVAAATSQYDLAIYSFKYATSVGTTRLPF